MDSLLDARRDRLLHTGGLLGVAGVVVGLLILVAGCGGFSAAVWFAPLPIAFGLAGLIVTVIALFQRRRPADSHVLGALFVSATSLMGGLAELVLAMNWSMKLG